MRANVWHFPSLEREKGDGLESLILGAKGERDRKMERFERCTLLIEVGGKVRYKDSQGIGRGDVHGTCGKNKNFKK